MTNKHLYVSAVSVKSFVFSCLNNNDFFIYVIKGNNVLLEQESNIQFQPTPVQQSLFDKLNSTINNISHDISENVNENDSPLDCNYYNLEEFTKAKFDSSKSFSILHLNIHLIQLHIEDLRILLSLLEYNFDIIAITESKLQRGILPTVDISIEGYKTLQSTATEAMKGGVLIYVANHINAKPRNDLLIYKAKKLESLFIEINNPNKCNSLVGVVYRHPSMEDSEFNDDLFKTIFR